MKRNDHINSGFDFSTDMLLDEEFDTFIDEELPHFAESAGDDIQSLAY